MSDHATLLIYDIHGAFCVGAWVSVIVMCSAGIDAVIRDTETGDYRSNSMKVFGDNERLQSLRRNRNLLVHVSEDGLRGISDFDAFHSNLEENAREAVELLFQTIYASPGT